MLPTLADVARDDSEWSKEIHDGYRAQNTIFDKTAQASKRTGLRHSSVVRSVRPRGDVSPWWQPGNFPCCVTLRRYSDFAVA